MEPLEGTSQAIKTLTELKRRLSLKREAAIQSVRECDVKLSKLTAALEVLLEEQRRPEDNSPRTALLRRLRGMTQPMALQEIAQYNGGVLIAQEARELMVHAGIMRESKYSASLVHKVIARTNMFERVARGKYKFVPDGPLLRIKTQIVNHVRVAEPAKELARPATAEDLRRIV